MAGIETGIMARLAEHWREYVAEGGCLSVFMLSAAGFAVVFQHPASPVAAAIGQLAASHPAMGRLPMAAAMGLTAAALIYSPPGRRSGAHMNPAVTLAFLRLGRIRPGDAAAYVAAQCVGAIGGMVAALVLFANLPAHPSVNYVATMPGLAGTRAAFIGEAAISALLMAVVIAMSSVPRLSRWTGAAAACLVALFITVEAPLSGMSMNPARTLGSAIFAGAEGLWIYLTAPPLAMLAIADVTVRLGAHRRVLCAKLRHHATGPCIFRCGHMETPA